jgi:hypothetical protein
MPAVTAVPALTATLVTNAQRVASIVHIKLVGSPPELVVEPDPVDVYYTHDGSLGDEMKPHRVVWMAMFDRQPGETLTIHLNAVTRPAKLAFTDPVFQHAFSARTAPKRTDTWVIEPNENSVETEPIDLLTDNYGRIDVKYDVTLAGGTRRIPPLDPGGNLIPDP